MSAKIIIVEGADNMGKSYLAQKLANRIGGAYWHMTSGQGLEEHGAMNRYQNSALDNAEFNLRHGRSTVFDRLWPSDLVYGTILRGRPSTDPELFIDRCNMLGVVYIACHRENAVAKHRLAQDPDHPYEDEVYRKVVNSYETFFRELPSRVDEELVIDYDMDMFAPKPALFQAFLDGVAML